MLSPMRILVVEDDKKIASFIVNGLKQSGYAVDHSSDGEDGLFRAQTIPYDAAVVDLMMPKLDGLGLIQQARAHGVRTPVLILSAKASVVLVQEAPQSFEVAATVASCWLRGR